MFQNNYFTESKINAHTLIAFWFFFNFINNHVGTRYRNLKSTDYGINELYILKLIVLFSIPEWK